MDSQIPGRVRPSEWDKQDDTLCFGLKHLTPGQQKFAYQKAQAYLERVMMDPNAPGLLKDIIRQQNSLGMIGLELLLASYVENELKDMAS